jgi:hypothetical protein
MPEREDRFIEAKTSTATRIDTDSLTVFFAELFQTKPAARIENGM